MDAERDAERFTALLDTLGEVYDVTVSPGRKTLYFGALREFDYEIVELAISKFLQSDASKYGFPKPAHLREIIEGSQSDQEANAWLALNEAVRAVGPWNSLIGADPYLAEAIVRTFGSWVTCCEAARESSYLWEQRRKEFVSAWRIAKKTPLRRRDPVLLGGLCELSNRAKGVFPKRSVYGTIQLDGKVRSQYLDIDVTRGLPAASMKEVLALPEPEYRLALPQRIDDEPEGELVSGEAIMTLEEAFRLLLREKTVPTSGPSKPRTVELTESDRRDEARRAELRRQAAAIHAENNQTEEASGAVRARETTRTGDSDHAANHGGGVADSDSGVRVRGGNRPKVESGSRVAGVEDSVRAGRKRVRERDPRGARRVDDEAGKGRKRPSESRTEQRRSSRRKT